MIGDILQSISKELATYIEKQTDFASGKKIIYLGKPTNSKGECIIPDNMISLSLVNLQEDISMRSPMIKKRVDGNKVYSQKPGMSFDFTVIFIANFPKDYVSELNYLTKIMEFFQEKSTFTPQNTKGLEKQTRYTEELIFKLNSGKIEEQAPLWNMLGLKYMPSIMYDVGKMIIQEEETLSSTRVVQTVEKVIKSK